MAIRFFVPGIPQTAGSKRAFPFKRRNGSLGVAVSDDNPKGRDWKAAIADTASRQRIGALLEGAIEIRLTFCVVRPKGHYRSGKISHLLKADAPAYPVPKPDSTKLCRCAEDALKSIVWVDDSQVVRQLVAKCYADKPGVLIEISELPAPESHAILFLDDNPERTAAFLRREPLAVTVETAEECKAALARQEWDEVHLDHDLNGEVYCDPARTDTGSEVIRWILLNKPSVMTFVVHTHNDRVHRSMCESLTKAGYRTILAPFDGRVF